MQVRPRKIGCAAILFVGATFLAWAMAEIEFHRIVADAQHLVEYGLGFSILSGRR